MFFLLAMKNLGRHRRRTGLSLAGMAIGGAALIVFLGFMENTFRGVRDTTIRTQTGHLQVLHRDWGEKSEMRPLELGIAGYEEIGAAIRRLPGVAVVAPRIEVNGIVVTKSRASATFIGTAVDPAAELAILRGPGESTSDPNLIANFEALAKVPDGVILGKTMARNLALRHLDPVRLYAAGVDGLRFVEARFVGSFAGPVMETDRFFAFLGVAKAQELLEERKVSRLIVTLADEDRLPSTLAAVGAILAARGGGAKARPWTEFAQFYGALVKLYRHLFVFMGVIIAALVVFAISNTMVMAVLERIGEIGTFMAIGMPRTTILKLFVYESMGLGVLGACAGLGLGALATLVINHSGLQIPPPPGATTSYPLHLIPTFGIYAMVFVVMVVTTLLASLYPAGKASRLEVVEALAHL